MHKVKQHKGVAVAAAVCAVAMAASLATHAGAAGDRRYCRLASVIDRH